MSNAALDYTEKDSDQLADSEVARILATLQSASFRPSTTHNLKTDKAFRPRSLMEIAAEAQKKAQQEADQKAQQQAQQQREKVAQQQAQQQAVQPPADDVPDHDTSSREAGDEAVLEQPLQTSGDPGLSPVAEMPAAANAPSAQPTDVPVSAAVEQPDSPAVSAPAAQPAEQNADGPPAIDTTSNAVSPDAVLDDHVDMTDDVTADVTADVTKAAAFETAEAAFERGRAAGIDEGRQAATAEITAAAKADAAAKLAAAINVFEDMATGLRSVSAVERGALDATIRAAILRLAADRAGLAIDSAPDAFFARIDKMVGAIEATMATAKIKINPDDLAAISPHLAQQAIDKSAFIADPGLARGDVMVSVNGIEMRDIAADRIDTGEALVETTSLPDAGPETDGTMADLTSDAGDASDSGEVDNRDAAEHAEHAEHADHPGQNTDDEPAT